MFPQHLQSKFMYFLRACTLNKVDWEAAGLDELKTFGLVKHLNERLQREIWGLLEMLYIIQYTFSRFYVWSKLPCGFRRSYVIRKSLFHFIFVLFYLNIKPKLWKLILNLKDPLQPFMRSYNINNDALASWISLPVFLDSLLLALQEMKSGSAVRNGCPWGFGGEKAILTWTQRGHDPLHHWAAIEGRGNWWTQRFNSSLLILFCLAIAELEQQEVSSSSCCKRRVQCNQNDCMQPSFISYIFHCSHHSQPLVSVCLLPHQLYSVAVSPPGKFFRKGVHCRHTKNGDCTRRKNPLGDGGTMFAHM